MAMVKAPDGGMHKVVTDDDKAYMEWWKREPHDKHPLSIPNFLRFTPTERKESWAKAPPPKPMPLFERRLNPDMQAALDLHEVLTEQRKRLGLKALRERAPKIVKVHRDRSFKTNSSKILVLLREPSGITLAQMQEITGRIKPTPIFSGMRKEGHIIDTSKNSKGETIWIIKSPASGKTTSAGGVTITSEPKGKASASKITRAVKLKKLAKKKGKRK